MAQDRLQIVLQELMSAFEPARDVRRALMGDGLNKTSTKVPGRNGYHFARDRADQNRVYQVLAGAAPDTPDWPVLIEKHILTADFRIIETDWVGLHPIPSFSGSYGVGPHHQQHEYMQWDMVHVHKGMLMPLRVIPTAPVSYDVLIQVDVVYIGDNLVDLRDIADYDATLQAVRKTLYIGPPAPTGTFWYLAYVSTEPDIEFVTGSTEDVGGFGPQMPSAEGIVGGYIPLAYVKIEKDAPAVAFQHIQDIRALYSFPEPQYATGVFITDPGNYFTGSTVEAALEELGHRTSQAELFAVGWFARTLATGVMEDLPEPYIIRPGVPELFRANCKDYVVATDIEMDIQIAVSVTGTWTSIFDTLPKIEVGYREVSNEYSFAVDYVSGEALRLLFNTFDDDIEHYRVTAQLGVREIAP